MNNICNINNIVYGDIELPPIKNFNMTKLVERINIINPVNLTVYCRKLINREFRNIVDIKLIALLGLKVIMPSHFYSSFQEILKQVEKQFNLNENSVNTRDIIISEIITNIAANNKDYFAYSKFKVEILNYLTQKYASANNRFTYKIEGFTNNFNNFNEDIERFGDIEFSRAKYYYMNEDNTIHKISNVKKVELTPNIEKDNIRLMSSEQLNSYANNANLIKNTIEIIDEQLVVNKTLKPENIARLVQMKTVLKHIYDNNLLLLSTYLDLTVLIAHLYNNKINSLEDITKLVNDVNFIQIANSISQLNLDNVSDAELFDYINYITRNLSVDDLKKVIYTDKLLDYIYKTFNDDYLMIVNDLENNGVVNFDDFEALSEENKQLLIDDLTNKHFASLLNKLSITDFKQFINFNQLEKIIKNLNIKIPTSGDVNSTIDNLLKEGNSIIYDLDYSLMFDNIVNNNNPEVTLDIINEIINKVL